MLFASTSLAARIERAECRLIIDCADAVRQREEADVCVIPISGGVAACAEASSPINKLAGLGFDGPLDEAELEAVERAFAERGAPLQVELSCLAEPSIGTFLTERGYQLQGFENVLGLHLPLEPPPTRNAEIEITPSDSEELAGWMDVIVTGFMIPDAQGVPSHESFPREIMERSIRDIAVTKGFLRYMARRAGEPAGAASMRLSEGIAQLCGSATLPVHRRRGVQTTLLATRLVDAGRRGCDVAVVTTLPGSKSQENVQRQGFDLLYTRAILVRPA